MNYNRDNVKFLIFLDILMSFNFILKQKCSVHCVITSRLYHRNRRIKHFHVKKLAIKCAVLSKNACVQYNISKNGRQCLEWETSKIKKDGTHHHVMSCR